MYIVMSKYFLYSRNVLKMFLLYYSFNILNTQYFHTVLTLILIKLSNRLDCIILSLRMN